MKNFILGLIAIFTLSLSISSCGNKAKTNAADEKTEVIDKTGKEYTSAYICPMHCKGSGSDKAGTCPICKMDYVVNKELKGDVHEGHDHEGHDHEGHDHGDNESHEGHDHGDHDGHNH